MRKEKGIGEMEDSLLECYAMVGSLIKCKGKREAALLNSRNAIAAMLEASLEDETASAAIRRLTHSQIVSYFAGRKIAIVESKKTSRKGVELRNYSGKWTVFAAGECVWNLQNMTSNCLEVLRILPA